MLLTIVYGVLVVGGTCLVALAGLELVQRLVPATSRQRHNDVAGFIYAALGRDLRRAHCARSYRRVGGIQRGQRNGRAGGQRPSRDRLAGPPAS